MHAMTSGPEDYDDEAMASAMAFSEAVIHTLNVARALVDSGQTVDLTGLDGGIGLLCAKVLDLPPDRGRALRPRLMDVLAALDGIATAMKDRDPP